MDFLINNIGWFFGIAIVSILALIGYKADNKEKQQNNNNNKYIPKEISTYEETPIENKNEEYKNNIEDKSTNDIPDTFQNEEEMLKQEDNSDMEDLFAPLTPSQTTTIPDNINNENEKDENPIYNQEPANTQEIEQQNNVQNNNEQVKIQEQIVPNINNIENLNISLQDLENKKYNELLNKVNNQQEQTSQEITKNIEESPIPETPILENNLEQENNNEIHNEENINEEQNTIEPQQTTNEIPENIQTQENVSKEQTNVEQSQETISEKENQIDEQPEIPQEQNENVTNQNNGINDFTFNQPEQNYTGEIPEIFSNIEQNNEIQNQSQLEKIENTNNGQEKTNLYDQSIDDDIWKF